MATDKANVSDEVTAEVKGPGDEWEGKHAESSDAPGALAIGEIQNEGTAEEVKGPGPEWETNSKGAYKNR